MPRVRVLHVVAQMNRGGAETWLMQVLRNLDPDAARMEFLVTRDAPGHYDAEIERLGSAVIRCDSPARPVRFARRFLAVLRARGSYDVVHCHEHHFSGFVLALAGHAGVPIRIAHSHSDTSRRDARAGFRRRVYLALMAAAIRRWATRGLAASDMAAAALFGPRWRDDPRWGIARCGLDFAPFREPADAATVRRELGVPERALVLGHVGRFDPAKNHALLLRIADCVRRRDSSAFLVLVGDGPTRTSVEAEAARLGMRERVVFAGIRSDVPRLLRAFDAFVLPSLHEGLPLVGLEAQAARLPIVLSDTITRELMVIAQLFTWRSVRDSPESWAESVIAAARSRRPDVDAAAILERSEFSLSGSLRGLLAAYGC